RRYLGDWRDCRGTACANGRPDHPDRAGQVARRGDPGAASREGARPWPRGPLRRSGAHSRAAEIAHKEPRIDVLINNAGAMFSSRRLTPEGLEYTFALNPMAYFVVTEGSRARLLAAAPARIVNAASAAHQGARLDFADLQLAKS